MKTFEQLNSTDQSTLIIVDSLNLAFRYKHKNAVGFCTDYMRTVDSLRKSYKAAKVVLCGDMGSSSYRKNLSPIYKQNRKDKFANQTQEEKEAFELFFLEVQEILANYEQEGTYPVLRFPGVEADDIAAYLVRKWKKVYKIWLMSSDRDWSLLIDSNVSQFSYVTRKEFTKENWSDHYPHSIEEYISIKVLQGDAGDNVIGVPGIGPKKALSLVQQYGSAYDISDMLPISSKYKYIQALNEFGSSNIELNYRLMDLITHCEEAVGEENCKQIDQKMTEYLST